MTRCRRLRVGYDRRVHDELVLLAMWRAGDKSAGGKLFERFYDALYRFFAAKVSGDVEDLIQQTVLACVEGRERIESFRAYLFGTARRILYKHFEGRERFDALASSLEDLAPSPGRLVDGERGSRLLVAALRRIPLELQILLELSYREGLSQRELAEATGLTKGMVQTRIERARQLLRRELGALASGQELDAAVVDLERWAPSYVLPHDDRS